jgi:TRAP transporter 4TM/12TM fusion protein
MDQNAEKAMAGGIGEEGLLRLTARVATIVAVCFALFHIYTGGFGALVAYEQRGVHLTFILVLCFMMTPYRKGRQISWPDICLAVLSAAAGVYLVFGADDIAERIGIPSTLDLFVGGAIMLLVLEATRRMIGAAISIVAGIVLLYAYFGYLAPLSIAHQGYPLERIISQMSLATEGIFGIPLGVSATFIVLFTIFGAILEASGAGKFYVDFALGCMGKSRAGAGRAVTLASFLLGTVSGSGAATAVTLGAVAWPLLKRSGYDRESAGGLLAAGGIGAVLSPPVLGAASFLIAEILRISYLEVLAMASIPTILYYASILFMVEGDARHLDLQQVSLGKIDVGALTKQYWFHFASLVTIVIFMALGYSAIKAVFYSTLIAIASSFLNRESALYPRKLMEALASGSEQVLGVGATCACAGIIVGTINLTGIGLKFSSVIIDIAGGHLFLTLILTALILLVLGLALPITASYIIAVVMTAPALVKLGVPEGAAHMFIFYYAVLSEVSPPMAITPFAAAAITGGNPFKTTMLAWKYTLPAFIVPFMFCASPEGIGLLLKGPVFNIVLVTLTALAGVWALSGAVGGYLVGPLGRVARAALAASGLLLFYAGTIQDLIGASILGVIVLQQVVRNRTQSGRGLRARGV